MKDLLIIEREKAIQIINRLNEIPGPKHSDIMEVINALQQSLEPIDKLLRDVLD